jgi:hypothetical protein
VFLRETVETRKKKGIREMKETGERSDWGDRGNLGEWGHRRHFGQFLTARGKSVWDGQGQQPNLEDGEPPTRDPSTTAHAAIG